MPRTLVATNIPSTSGLAMGGGSYTTADVVNGNEFANDGNVVLIVTNGDGALARTVTFYSQGTIDGSSVPSKVVSVPSLGTRWFGPFRPQRYNDDNGRIPVDGENTSISFQVIRLPEVS